MKSELGSTKHQYFKEKCPWGNSKVLGKKYIFDLLLLSEQNALQVLKIFLIIQKELFARVLKL